MLLQHSLSTRYLLILFLCLFGCRNSNEKNDRLFKLLHEGLQNSDQTIDIQTKWLYESLKGKAADPATAERARIWLDKVEKIKELTDAMENSIDDSKQILEKEQALSFDQAKKLYDNLLLYKKTLMQVDPEIKDKFDNTIRLTTMAIDTSADPVNTFYTDYISGLSKTGLLAVIARLENNVKYIETTLTTFCFYHVSASHRDYEIISAMAYQSSSIVGPGEKIEIISGIGSFSRAAAPVITIAGHQVKLDDDAIGHYTFKAKNEPGKYSVPVKISFYKPDGTQATIEKNVEYKVVVCQEDKQE